MIPNSILQAVLFAYAHRETWASIEPVAIHANDFPALVAGLLLRGSRLVPIVYDSHELWTERNSAAGRFVRRVERRIEARAVGQCDAVITVSPSISRWITDKYGLSPDRVHTVRNIFNNGSSVTRHARDAERSTTVLLYIGRITPGRGLVEAVTALRNLPDDYRLRIVGYGPEAFVETLVALVESSGVRSRVEFVDAVAPEHVVAEAGKADIALVAIEPVCLSYRYALPNKLFEAIQAQLPVVASDLPDIGEVVRRYDIGVVYDPGDAVGLAEAVRAVRSDEARFRANVAVAAQELTWVHEEGVLQNLYERVLDRRRPVPAP